MTAPTATETTYVTLKELAARWRVSVGTARNRTRAPGFPLPLEVGPRCRRWPLDEVESCDKTDRAATARRVVTGKRPQHHKAGLRPPAQVRTVLRPAR